MKEVTEVTIGVPVYNGGAFLDETLESLRAQDHPSVSIIISDNASTDQTEAICSAHAQADSRVTYVRQSVNRGAIWNFNEVFRLADSPYFMWGSSHDLWAPTYVRACCSVLHADPGSAMAYPRAESLDAEGVTADISDDLVLNQSNALDRYITLIWQLTWCNMVHGVFRTSALRKTRGFVDVWAPDHLLLAEAVLAGAFQRIEQPLFRRRLTRLHETDEIRVRRVLTDLNPSSASSRVGAPPRLAAALQREHIRAVLRSQLKAREKPVAIASTLTCFRDRFGVESRAVKVLSRLTPLGWKERASRQIRRPGPGKD